MARQRPKSTENDGDESTTGRLARGRDALEESVESGTLALAAGGVLLARSLVGAPRGVRRLGGAALGAALVGVGLRRRTTLERADGTSADDASTAVQPDEGGGSDDVSADAAAELERPVDERPRDPGAEGDSEDEGDVQFTREPDDTAARANLEDDDPRLSGTADEEVEVDISEAAMADEPSEAAGPASQQSVPTTIDDSTTPAADEAEPTTEDAAEKRADPGDGGNGDDDGGGITGSDAATTGGEDDEETDREALETDDDTTIHTDTMEAGTTDVDVDDVTDPDDDLNEEPAGSDQQSSPRLDDESETVDADDDPGPDDDSGGGVDGDRRAGADRADEDVEE